MGLLVLGLLAGIALLWLWADNRRKPTQPVGLPVFDRLARQRGFTLAEPSSPRRPSPVGRPLPDTEEEK